MAVGTPGKNNYSTTHRYSLRFPAASIRSQILLTALKIDVAPTPFVSPTTIGILVSRTISPTTLPLHPTWSATTLLARGYQSRSYHSSDIYAETCTKRVPAAAVPPIINCTIVKFFPATFKLQVLYPLSLLYRLPNRCLVLLSISPRGEI